ncbi:UBP1-associated proteins 1C [Glycine soja]
MVWFQCEDCGDNLKKPKLSSHFRTCSAYKLSCIDCGEIFGRDTVQDHTQCITEAEKYGPKGQGKTLNVATANPNKDSKQRPDIDINHPDRILKMKKLRKVVLRALQECGIVVDDTELSEALEQKINSSSRFAVENKYVRLLAKD